MADVSYTAEFMRNNAVQASTVGAAQANNSSLAAVVGARNYLTGIEVCGGGATGALAITVTVTGLKGGTRSYMLEIPAGAGVALAPFAVQFNPPLPASATNTAITLNVPTFGAGNTAAGSAISGFLINEI